MKKKIILTLTACLFAAGSIINMHLAQNDQNTDISLADISVMAQADGESGMPNYCDGRVANECYTGVSSKFCLTVHDWDTYCN